MRMAARNVIVGLALVWAAGCSGTTPLSSQTETGAAGTGAAGSGSSLEGTAGLGVSPTGAGGTGVILGGVGAGGSSAYGADGPSPTLGLYRITARRNLAPPARADGITFDGALPWTLARGGSEQSFHDHVVSFDPATVTTLKSLDVGQTYSSAPAWDGAAIWLIQAGGLARIDVTTGAVLKSMSSPRFGRELDHDGRWLWLTAEGDHVFQIDPASGGVERSFETGGDPTGIASRPGELWIGGEAGGLGVWDPATGARVADVVGADGKSVADVIFGDLCFANGQLVAYSWRIPSKQQGVTFYDVERLR